MYPKVKVRTQEEDGDQLSLHDQVAFDLVSLHDLDSSVWGDEDDSPPAVVRVPESYLSDLATEGEGTSINKEKDVDCGKQNIRASPIRPPRAVLSSPVNDGKVEPGSRTKTKPDLLSGLKDHNLCQNRHTRCKVVPSTQEPWCHHMAGSREPSCYHHRHKAQEATATTAKRVSKEASAGKPILDEKKGSATMAIPTHRSKIKKKRPEFVCI